MAAIPGLGLMEEAVRLFRPSLPLEFELPPFGEYCFEVGFGSPGITLKLVSGTAEKDGTELNLNHTYHFSSIKSKILTLQGCKLEISGPCDREWVVKDPSPAENVANMYVNIHFKLHNERLEAAARGRTGPRILIAGSPNSGKTTCAKTLAAYATRTGDQPLVVNLNPDEGVLTLPGTLSAAVGPGSIPPKLPIVHFYGHQNVDDDPGLYREIATTLAESVSARLSEDPNVKKAGLIIDTTGVDVNNQEGLETLSHIISEFSVNVVVIIDANGLEEQLQALLKDEMANPEEPLHLLSIGKFKTIPERDELWLLQEREADIKEYFFGDARMVLSPSTQLVDFDTLTIFKLPDNGEYTPDAKALDRIKPFADMVHWTLAIMQASVKDSPETIRASLVLGFVYVAHVDVDKAKIKLLAPLPGRLGDRPLVLGKWPEPHVNLLG
ncbi:unnamed protein product [Parascedosporium putredinis]|uniref:Polynucleotide 5'-hydroxyl-kinase GRC3 n=1 Tax=Parascedosporium putredinis TaxID=1442378 RepID=A0A9P1GVI2_9PEZI|nr:unnamed protein product [Parascedosporium putredinis]CAI7987830.1 unnamed protein product [Parascedosporium putredinis]